MDKIGFQNGSAGFMIFIQVLQVRNHKAFEFLPNFAKGRDYQAQILFCSTAVRRGHFKSLSQGLLRFSIMTATVKH